MVLIIAHPNQLALAGIFSAEHGDAGDKDTSALPGYDRDITNEQDGCTDLRYATRNAMGDFFMVQL